MSSFCLPNPPDPLRPDVPKILDFLQRGLEIGLKPSTLKVQVSALSSIFDQDLAGHRWIKRFMTSANRINPGKQVIVPPWDLNIVLQGLTGPPFEPLSTCSPQNLAYKTVFLVAITSARRVGEFQALSIREPYLLVREDSIILRLDPSFLPKVVSEFHRSQEIVLPTFCNNPANSEERKCNTVDVRRILLHYLDQSRALRVDHNLFVHSSGQNKGKKVAKSTIATWIKKAITEAYFAQNKLPPVGIKAHSTRSTSVSWAERAGQRDNLHMPSWKVPRNRINAVTVTADKGRSCGTEDQLSGRRSRTPGPDILKNEGKALHGLSVLGIKNEDLIKYLQLQVHPGEENYALDIHNSAINWANDIETDYKYSKWPSSLQELLRPVFPGAIRPIRRNFFNLVLFLDPAQDYAADYVKLAELFYQHNVPLRVGFVFVVSSGEAVEDAGAALWCAFNYMADESDASHAFTSLISGKKYITPETKL
ncbi:unnamed protein product [Ranitomeya imitator]|uniref:UGGT thioredoxin-like domain-containing protein n=1 Tax=Ranitomeya imitator TaxID=111125 RepID=A0ABN9LX54_9NEOB|nr:unnamed protein product [Ranitomeya imitator]